MNLWFYPSSCTVCFTSCVRFFLCLNPISIESDYEHLVRYGLMSVRHCGKIISFRMAKHFTCPRHLIYTISPHQDLAGKPAYQLMQSTFHLIPVSSILPVSWMKWNEARRPVFLSARLCLCSRTEWKWIKHEQTSCHICREDRAENLKGSQKPFLFSVVFKEMEPLVCERR